MENLKKVLQFETDKDANSSGDVRERADIPDKYKWDLTKVFESLDAFEAGFKTLNEALPRLASYKGRLSESAKTLEMILTDLEQTGLLFSDLYLYANSLKDQDMRVSENLSLASRVMAAGASLGESTSYVQGEILRIGKEKIDAFMKEDETLALRAHYFDDLFRSNSHTLSDEEERVLALLSPVTGSAYTIMSRLTNADMTFDPAQDEKGESHAVSSARMRVLLDSPDRTLRKNAFDSLYRSFANHRNTLAETLSTQIRAINTLAKLRKFNSSREAALFQNNIPEAVYDALVETIHKQLPQLHRYTALRKKLLGLDKLYPWDMYKTLLGDVSLKFTYEEAKELVIEALAPLGEDYVNVVRSAFDSGWIDVYENKGKRSGAYSSGVYNTMPYILLNFSGTLDDVYTLIHEMGHSMHSYLTRSHQSLTYGDYCIFLAEIASTCNENLLTQHLLKKYEDQPEILAYILNQQIDTIRGTVYRQTQFAEFEYMIAKADAEGVALTADYLDSCYGSLNEKYYGEALEKNETIAKEWSRVPHFYYDFYVFQYATGFSAASAFQKKILEGGEEARERYLGFLKAGSSAYPIDVLKTAGVDMTSPEPIEAVLKLFGEYLDAFESVLKKLGRL